MPYADINGINTHYQVSGNGAPIVMLAPAGFDSSIGRWSARGVWKDLRPCTSLADKFQVIAYDRREAGKSGGRLEVLDWPLYAQQAVGLLDHLGIQQAFFLGACMGCAVALKIGALFPQRCLGLLLHWPVGGYRWRAKLHGMFDQHIAFLNAHGLQGVRERAQKSGVFFYDPECGPWSAAIANDAAFADAFVRQDVAAYLALLEASRDRMFNDTMPSGATGAEMMNISVPTYIMPGDDAAHSHSSAQTVRELVANAALSSVMPPQQSAELVDRWIRESAGSAK